MAFPSMQREFQASHFPWLSGGLVLAALVILLLLPALPDPGDHTQKGALDDAFTYWQTHGYLEPNAEIEALAELRFDDRSRPVALAALRELGRRSMPESASARRAEQARLDILSLAATVDPEDFNPLPENHPLRIYGFEPDRPSALSAITHVFLHAGWLHFLSVAPLFFFLGAAAEQRWGRSALSMFLLCATLFSTASYALIEQGSPMTLLGGQAPVAALFAVFMVRHRNDAVRWNVPTVRARSLRWTSHEIPPVVVPALFLVASLGQLVWLEEIGTRNDLSVTALFSGLVFGVGASFLLRGLGYERKSLGAEVDAQIFESDTSPSLDEAIVATDMGDVDRGFELLAAEAEQKPDDCDVIRRYWELAVSTGQAESAATPVGNHICGLLRKNRLSDATTLWCELAEQLPDHRLPPAELVRMSPTLLAEHDVEFACAALRQAVGADEIGIGIALEIVELARELDPFTALLACRRALEFEELHPSKRARIQMLMQDLDPEIDAELEVEEPVGPPPSLASHGGELAAPSPSRIPALEEDIDHDALFLPDDPLPPSNANRYADPEVTQAPFLQTPPPEIVLPASVVHEAAQEVDAIDLSALPRFDSIRLVAAVPTEFTDDALYFRLGNGRRAKVAYREVQALSVAALRDVSSKPVVVIDLLLNWNELGEAPLRSIRMRSDQFDPTRLLEARATPTENLQAFLEEILGRTGALALPDKGAAVGRPFRAFKFLRGYQRRVLKVDC